MHGTYAGTPLWSRRVFGRHRELLFLSECSAHRRAASKQPPAICAPLAGSVPSGRARRGGRGWMAVRGARGKDPPLSLTRRRHGAVHQPWESDYTLQRAGFMWDSPARSENSQPGSRLVNRADWVHREQRLGRKHCVASEEVKWLVSAP